MAVCRLTWKVKASSPAGRAFPPNSFRRMIALAALRAGLPWRRTQVLSDYLLRFNVPVINYRSFDSVGCLINQEEPDFEIEHKCLGEARLAIRQLPWGLTKPAK